MKEKDWWLILLVVGIVILNYPLISIFDRDIDIFGFPLFFIYLYVGWIISIFVIYLYVKMLDKS